MLVVSIIIFADSDARSYGANGIVKSGDSSHEEYGGR